MRPRTHPDVGVPDTGPWTYRALAGAPLAAALGAMLVATVGAQSQGALLATVSASKVLALFGCLLAALSFAPREAQFRGWALHALSYALLVQRDAILHRGLLGPIDAPHVAAIESALLVTANGAGLIGLGLLARAWRPLDDAPGAAARRTMVRVAAVVLALFIAAPSLWVNVEELLGGSLQAISGVATVLVDAAALAMLAPAALAVVGSRQESPGWAWALLTASLVGWLCFDAAVAIQAMTRPSDHAFGVTAEMFRVFSCVATCSAGIAQRLASRAA
jgi:hypothetical protein